eukprot:TRINITY_DN2905_c0_g1_i1.p5 TRINITY_DN2905_c0_g1~~TRINITY_DN2905_c0_g1_i1.p5  ORF type:complete len:132 (-),score=30.51 TRINITY_DN2905_c0_g1_i1:1616-2011(-)
MGGNADEAHGEEQDQEQEASKVNGVAQEAEEPASGEEEESETGEDEGSDETALKVTVDDINTAPMDFRFPTTNQAKHCYTRYNEYHKCVAEKGEGASECNKYAKYYRSLCPGEWIERWNEQRENGTFAGRY